MPRVTLIEEIDRHLLELGTFQTSSSWVLGIRPAGEDKSYPGRSIFADGLKWWRLQSFSSSNKNEPVRGAVLTENLVTKAF